MQNDHVAPAQAGGQCRAAAMRNPGARLRGNDEDGFRDELTPNHPKNIMTLNIPST
jgi:hypothetical protein